MAKWLAQMNSITTTDGAEAAQQAQAIAEENFGYSEGYDRTYVPGSYNVDDGMPSPSYPAIWAWMQQMHQQLVGN